MHRLALAAVSLCLAGTLARPAVAASCTGGSAGTVSVTVEPLSFGGYYASANASTVEPFSVTISCVGGDSSSTVPPVSISLGTGSGSFAKRAMTSGSSSLNYQIYTSASLAVVWGDGTGGSSPVTGGGSSSSQIFTGYGEVPARQWVIPGAYTDTLTVTVSY